MADIFLSYSRADITQARSVVERLEHEGWTVFWDRQTPVGKTWTEVLESELTQAGCVLVLWSTTAIGSRWVVEEAELAANRTVLIPARLHAVTPPVGFTRIHACDLTDWDAGPDSSALQPLVEELARCLGKRRGVSLQPLELAVVLARPSRHPDVGHLVNLTCELRNDLDRDAELRSIEASADWPNGEGQDLSLRLLYDPKGLEHVRRFQDDVRIRIPAGGLSTGLQLMTSVVTGVVLWPAGHYEFQVRGWVNRYRRQGEANLRTTFDADLAFRDALVIEEHARWSDEQWRQAGYSDDAVGIPMRLGTSRTSVPAV